MENTARVELAAHVLSIAAPVTVPIMGKISKGVVGFKQRGNAANGRGRERGGEGACVCVCVLGGERRQQRVGMEMNEKWTQTTCLLLPFTV